MPMTPAKREAVANDVVAGLSYPQIAEKHYPNAEFPSQTVYNVLRQKNIAATIAEKQAKIYNPDELQAIASKRIKQIDETLSKGKLEKKIGLLGKEKDYLELQGRFQGAFIDKSMILNIDTTLDEVNERATQLLQQGRGEADKGNSASLT